jgi:hypothetical protein
MGGFKEWVDGWVGWFKVWVDRWAVCEVKTKGFIKPLSLGWMGGRRVRVRGVYRFSSLMKQNKKGKNCAVFCFSGFFF